MKLLLAIEARDDKVLRDNALRWCGRLGYEMRLFVPLLRGAKFKRAIRYVNYHHYLQVPESIVEDRHNARDYAWRHDFDLILLVPESLTEWRKKTAYTDNEIFNVVKDVGEARKEFANPRKKIKKFRNGATMERVKK